jgi:hypothetical protein
MLLNLMAKTMFGPIERAELAAKLRDAAEKLEKNDVAAALKSYATATTFIIGRVKQKFPVTNDKIIDFLAGLAK